MNGVIWCFDTICIVSYGIEWCQIGNGKSFMTPSPAPIYIPWQQSTTEPRAGQLLLPQTRLFWHSS